MTAGSVRASVRNASGLRYVYVYARAARNVERTLRRKGRRAAGYTACCLKTFS